MDDLISRQAVIEINRSYHGQMPNEVNHRIWKEINELPSAQPTEASCWGCNCQKMERLKEQKTFSEMVHLHDAETHEERTETHACDLISRQAAIDAVENIDCSDGVGISALKCEAVDDGVTAIKALPSAPPEQTNSWCINSWCNNCKEYDTENKCCPRYNRVIKQTLDDAYRHGETEAEARLHAQQRWIPCSERLPDKLVEVNITWINTNPTPYYEFIKGKPNTGSAVYYKGRWYWYSAVCADYLAEYGFSPDDDMDDAIKVIAWMPFPEPYREEGD